ncbi:hypothetical protein AB0442_29520 [Kitasatospora sp. NPDC085895]|uniref:hypothetical protein n=1 Tax=Kitasatospora sp. NPDC085895 TaxID=3155057 RepID=UPI00344FD4EB
MSTPVKVDVRYVTRSAELHRRYHGQSQAQPVYVELGLGDGVLLASYDAEVGGGRPAEVHHGIDWRWTIPILQAEAANELLDELAPLAQQVLDGSEVVWDGHNRVGRILTDEAQAAFDAIGERCAALTDEDEGVLPVWDMDSIGDAWTADEAGITAETTDAELEEIEARLLQEFREGQDQPHAVIEGLTEHLRQLRDDLAAEQD